MSAKTREERNTALMERRKRNHLLRYPHLQAEAIAEHYTKLAMIAMDLRHLTNMRRHADHDNTEIDWAINNITDGIKRQHLEDFGIPLEWEEEEAP